MFLLDKTLATAPHRVRKATLNQLKNRLGARARKYPFDMVPGGTLSRLLYIMEQHPRSFSGFLWFLEWTGFTFDNKDWITSLGPGLYGRPNEAVDKGFLHPAWETVEGSRALEEDMKLTGADGDEGKATGWWKLPLPHVRNRIDPYLPWLASHFDAMLDTDSQDEFLRRWIPPELIEREGRMTREEAYLDRWWQGYDGGALLRQRYRRGTINSIIDWIEAETVDFMRLTPAQALLRSIAWHSQLSGGQNFRCPVPEGVRIAQWPDGAHVDRLVTKDQLRWEGTSMGHCVGGPIGDDGVAPGGGYYWQRVREGKSAIISYRDPHGIPWMTIEVSTPSGELVQAMGPMDLLIEDWDDEMVPHPLEEQGWLDDYEQDWGEFPDLNRPRDRMEAFMAITGMDGSNYYMRMDEQGTPAQAIPKVPIGRMGTDPDSPDGPFSPEWMQAIGPHLSRSRLTELHNSVRKVLWIRKELDEWLNSGTTIEHDREMKRLAHNLTSASLLIAQQTTSDSSCHERSHISPIIRSELLEIAPRSNSRVKAFVMTIHEPPLVIDWDVIRRPLWIVLHGPPEELWLVSYSSVDELLRIASPDEKPQWYREWRDCKPLQGPQHETYRGTVSLARPGGGAYAEVNLSVGISDRGLIEAIRAAGAAIDPEEIEAHDEHVIAEDEQVRSGDETRTSMSLLWPDSAILLDQGAFLDVTGTETGTTR